MMLSITFFQQALDWSEVWAVLIPFVVLLYRRRQPKHFKPIIAYLVIAFVLDLFIDVGWLYTKYMPYWLQSNNYLYNAHSIIRFICFGYFFLLLDPGQPSIIKKTISILTALFIAINFMFFENFFEFQTFSSRLFAVESAVLLLFCLLYYKKNFEDMNTSDKWPAEFWIVTGMSIYVVFNFPYFLFYTTLVENHKKFAEAMWNFHNVFFIILFIFIAKGFYVAGHK